MEIKYPKNFSLRISSAGGTALIDVSVGVFSGGEVHVKLSAGMPYVQSPESARLILKAFVKNSQDVMTLLLVKDAIDRHPYLHNYPVYLELPYLPYARQDRVCAPGEALSLKVMCNLINSCNFKRVWVDDPHSPVSEALLDRLSVNSVSQGLSSLLYDTEYRLTKQSAGIPLVVVAPDQGATKRALDFVNAYNKVNVTMPCGFVQAYKHRDPMDGKISKTEVLDPGGLLKGANVLIVDDICDGGRTFVELAKVLKPSEPNTLNLYVTHGIFSAGFEDLLVFNKILCKNIFPETYPDLVDKI